MVQDIESFQSKRRVQVLVDGENTGYLGIKLEFPFTPEGVSADISQRSIARACQGGKRASRCVRASIRNLSECVWVQISPVRLTSIAPKMGMKIERNSGNQVGTIMADIGEGVVLP